MSSKVALKSTKSTKGKKKYSPKNKVIEVTEISESESESDKEGEMSDKPKPFTLLFRSRNANKNGELTLLLKFINLQADDLGIDGQDRSQALNTLLSPITDDTYEILKEKEKKCKKADKKKEKKPKFIPKDSNEKPLPRIKNAYQLFCKDERPKIKAANPELVTAEISKVLGRSWSKLKSSKKTEDKKRFKKYNSLSEKLKIEREKETLSQKNKAIENGEFEEPLDKKSENIWIIFKCSDEMKQELIDKNITDLKERMNYLSNRWHKMEDEEKNIYFERSELIKKQNAKNLIAYQKRCAKRKKKIDEASNSNNNSSTEQNNDSQNELELDLENTNDNADENESDHESEDDSSEDEDED
tara:strand:+ start:6409 stop:7482 length:1074 start_codon:yes stop_codon:yes gene_type:complete